jgi:hypothetical protein
MNRRQIVVDQVIVRTYKAKRQADAARDFAKDAQKLAATGYFPVSQSWGEGNSGCRRVILLGFVGALVFKPAGTLTVTYRHEEPKPVEAPVA